MFSPKLKLPVHGQGVFLFTSANQKEASFSVVGGNNKFHVQLTSESVNVTSFPSGDKLIDTKNHSGLV